MPKKNIAQWLYENLEDRKFPGLFWEDKRCFKFKLRWENHGKPNYEQTLEICKAYRARVNGTIDLTDSKLKNRFHQALEKSPYVILLESQCNKQENNFFLCQFIKLAENGNCLTEQESVLSGSVARAEPMDTNEQASVRGEIDKFIASFPREKLDSYWISLYYDGKQISTLEIDLSNKYRFHSGDRQQQLEEAKKAIGPCIPQKIADLEVPSISFTPYEGSEEKTKKYLRDSDYGIHLSSQGGVLKTKRLCQNKVYYSNYHPGKFDKLPRWKEETIFSLRKFAEGQSSRTVDLQKEVHISYGKKPKPGIASHIDLVITHSLIPHVLSISGETSIESSSLSLEDSLDRGVRLGRAFHEVEEIIDREQ